MGDRTGIEWTRGDDGTPGATWNPVTGCTKVSPGCDNCYAETTANRFAGTPGHYYERGFEVTLRPDKLDQPLRWRRPRRVFVNSMSDLFHDAIPDEYIGTVFDVMARAPQHTFQILTKRHGRMRSLLTRWAAGEDRYVAQFHPDGRPIAPGGSGHIRIVGEYEPLPNVHLVVSVENQQWAETRIPVLLDTPAVVRGVSCEPLLGPVELGHMLARDEFDRGIDWVIVGGESGRHARPMHPDWARQLRDQCTAAGVPFFFKQHGEWGPIQHPFDYVTNDDRCQVIDATGKLRGRPWLGWKNDLPQAEVVRRYGKRKAGRLLDGRTWDEYPKEDP